jgi:hypothetical protein
MGASGPNLTALLAIRREPAIRAVGDLMHRTVVVGWWCWCCETEVEDLGVEDMFGSRLNLVSPTLGFDMTAAFITFIYVRFIFCRRCSHPRRRTSRRISTTRCVQHLDPKFPTSLSTRLFFR